MSEEEIIKELDKVINNNKDRVFMTGKLNYVAMAESCKFKILDLQDQLHQKENIIKEVREYITSYESIETIQQFDHNKNNKDLDYSTIDEMTRRYMIVHDKLLNILDKGE